jgi:excisionase family DNA binding protein
MPDHPAPTFLTPREVADRWQMGRSTIYEIIARGELPFYRLGKSIRIALEDVEEYETAGRVEPPATPLRLRGRVRPT